MATLKIAWWMVRIRYIALCTAEMEVEKGMRSGRDMFERGSAASVHTSPNRERRMAGVRRTRLQMRPRTGSPGTWLWVYKMASRQQIKQLESAPPTLANAKKEDTKNISFHVRQCQEL